MTRVFISYRRADAEASAWRLYDHLAQHLPADTIFLDTSDQAGLKPGQDFPATLDAAVDACTVLLALIGPQWLTLVHADGTPRLHDPHDFVAREIGRALAAGKHVVPVLVQGASVPSADALPAALKLLAHKNAIVLSQARLADEVRALVAALRPLLAAPTPAITSATTSVSAKRDALRALRARLLAFSDAPLYDVRTTQGSAPSLGEGSPDAAIMFIGQNPGPQEAATGRTFVGESGKVLDEMLAHVGLRRNDVFLTNVVLDPTPSKRDPLPSEVAAYRPFLDALIDEIVQPRVLVPLGRFAADEVLARVGLAARRGPMSKLHGQLIPARAAYGDVHVLPLYHPAYVLYNASQRDVLRRDFEKLRLFA